MRQRKVRTLDGGEVTFLYPENEAERRAMERDPNPPIGGIGPQNLPHPPYADEPRTKRRPQ